MRGTWQIEATPAGEAIAPAAQRVIASMRALAPCAGCSTVEVGGSGAEFTDQRAAIADSLPYAVAILAAGTLLVLWLMTGSVLLPLMAFLMNALTVSAATGLLVLIFQDGRLQGLLDYSSQRGIEQSNYLVLAAIAFALSTDYGVFLLTCIKEAHDHGRSPRESIALGLQRTGRIVTAAAVLLAVAIGAFATSNVVFLKEIGVGAVAAVLLDAFVVRTLLAPALMGLLGRAAWYSPYEPRAMSAGSTENLPPPGGCSTSEAEWRIRPPSRPAARVVAAADRRVSCASGVTRSDVNNGQPSASKG
jgi:RND superfamily putative drug exporter